MATFFISLGFVGAGISSSGHKKDSSVTMNHAVPSECLTGTQCRVRWAITVIKGWDMHLALCRSEWRWHVMVIGSLCDHHCPDASTEGNGVLECSLSTNPWTLPLGALGISSMVLSPGRTFYALGETARFLVEPERQNHAVKRFQTKDNQRSNMKRLENQTWTTDGNQYESGRN